MDTLVGVAQPVATLKQHPSRKQPTQTESTAFVRRLGRWLAIVSLGRGPRA